MNKRKNQGFTLIEMLAVIAIIAVLVSIIVPVVSDASGKAAAAADAANLRSAKAAIAMGRLEGKYANAADITAEKLGIPAVGNYQDQVFNVKIENDIVTVFYGERTISALAYIAETGQEPAEPEETTSPTTP